MIAGSAVPIPQPPPPSEDLYAVADSFLGDLESFIADEIRAFESELHPLVDYVLARRGKRLRSLLVFLSGTDTDLKHTAEQVRIAAVIEMVHLATLVHDDILDAAELRHNRETVAQRFGASAAVLLGDALFAQALNLAADFPTTEVCQAVSVATRRVCAGEIEQTLQTAHKPHDYRRYFRIIELKTAELFDVSCRLGARFGTPQPLGFAAAAGDFGRQLGIAYQIYDDLVDVLGDESDIGKTLGTDVLSGKMTLPMIRLFESLDPGESQAIRQDIALGDPAVLDRITQRIRDLQIAERVQKEFEFTLESGGGHLDPYPDLPAAVHLRHLKTLLLQKCHDLRAPRSSR